MQHIFSYRFFSKAFIVFSWFLFLHCLIVGAKIELDRGGIYVSYEQFKLNSQKNSFGCSRVPGLIKLTGWRAVSTGIRGNRFWTVYPTEVELPKTFIPTCTMNMMAMRVPNVTIYFLIPAIYLQMLSHLSVTRTFRKILILANY